MSHFIVLPLLLPELTLTLERKKIAILQSNYIPWKGYFDIIAAVDEFIVYDEVQYTKNDWRNRNKIKTSAGVQWITIPVYQKKLSQKISETQVSDTRWALKNWNSIKSSYGRAPYFKELAEPFETFYTTTKLKLLSEINLFLITLICDVLGIKTVIKNSADYLLEGDPTERLVNLCKQCQAGIYISGPAAKNYLREDLFRQENIEISWMDYSGYPEYPQAHPPFSHYVSIVDLLFNTGKNASSYMKFGLV
jgi:hypothetical protein